MAHNLETNGTQATFASRLEPAWHGLGTVFTEDLNTQQMLETAHLANWNVRLEPVTFPEGYQSHKEYFSVVRDNPFEPTQQDVLGMVGERYKVLSNEELFDFGDLLLDGGRWETAGSIANGTRVFGSLALDHEMVLDPDGVTDKVNSYLLLHSSHDGSSSITASITPVRVVCQNTLTVALAGAKQSFKVRHTSTVQGKIASAREALGLADKYLDAFEQEAQRLIEQEITKSQFDKMVSLLFPEPEADVKGSRAKWQTKVDTIQSLYLGNTGILASGENAWTAWNALNEQMAYYRTARGNEGENLLVDASGLNPIYTSKNGDLLSVVKQVAFA